MVVFVEPEVRNYEQEALDSRASQEGKEWPDLADYAEKAIAHDAISTLSHVQGCALLAFSPSFSAALALFVAKLFANSIFIGPVPDARVIVGEALPVFKAIALDAS